MLCQCCMQQPSACISISKKDDIKKKRSRFVNRNNCQSRGASVIYIKHLLKISFKKRDQG